jgi:hypothetical protein
MLDKSSVARRVTSNAGQVRRYLRNDAPAVPHLAAILTAVRSAPRDLIAMRY